MFDVRAEMIELVMTMIRKLPNNGPYNKALLFGHLMRLIENKNINDEQSIRR